MKLPNDLVPKSLAVQMAEWRRDAKPWKPWPYQERSLKFMLENSRAGLLLSPGMGKTSVSLAAIKILLKKKLAHRVLVIAPLRPVYAVWPAEVCEWADFKDMRIALLHGINKDRVLRTLTPEHRICIINPEGCQWLMSKRANMKVLDADTLIIDECFAAGTLISTPHGKLPIESLHDGDIIINESGTHSIIGVTAHKPAGNVVEVRVNAKTIRCTEDHPFFTELGWLPAKCLEGRRLLGITTLHNMQKNNAMSSGSFTKRTCASLLAILQSETTGKEGADNCTTLCKNSKTTREPHLEDTKTCFAEKAKSITYFRRPATANNKLDTQNCRHSLRNLWQKGVTRSKASGKRLTSNMLTCVRHSLDVEAGEGAGEADGG